MIRLQKAEEPEVLERNADDWTEQLLEKIEQEGGDYPSSWARRRYGKPDIKERIIEEAYEKCIYCESKVREVYPGDIEHIQPKSKFPDLTFEWRNLAFACQECNRRKRDQWPNESPPVNPFTNDPSVFLQAVGAFIKGRPGNTRGEITVGIVDLNRAPLLERRGEKIDQLHSLASRIVDVDDADLQELLLRELDQLIADASPYAFVGRAYVTSISDDLP